jgi:hypothetical protein
MRNERRLCVEHGKGQNSACDRRGWQFTLQGGPHHGMKVRIWEDTPNQVHTLPAWFEIQGSRYYRTMITERKYDYVYEEP